MKLFLTLLPLMSTAVKASVLSLGPDNYQSATAGKTVFIKFFAPWCGHCKQMAPDWEKLAGEWSSSPVGLIAEVDCDNDVNDDICASAGVEGFPSLKWGDIDNLQDYSGSRDYESMALFASENLKPICSPSNLDLCTDEERETIEKYTNMPIDELEDLVDKIEESLEAANANFEKEVEGLQEMYEGFTKARDETVKQVKKEYQSGIVKSVLKAKEDAEDSGSDEL